MTRAISRLVRRTSWLQVDRFACLGWRVSESLRLSEMSAEVSGPLVDECALATIGESVDCARARVERDAFGFAVDGV